MIGIAGMLMGTALGVMISSSSPAVSCPPALEEAVGFSLIYSGYPPEPTEEDNRFFLETCGFDSFSAPKREAPLDEGAFQVP